MTMKTIFIGVSDPRYALTLANRSSALGVEVVGQSHREVDITNAILREEPDFAILEENNPQIHGFRVAKMLRKEGIKTRFISFLPRHDTRLIREAFYSSVSSIIFSDDGITELAECFSALGILSKEQSRTLTQDYGELKSDSAQDLLNTLTPCQLKILALVTRHMTMPEIAKELYISRHTVNNHISNIRKRLKLKGRGVILKYALENQHRLSEIEQLLTYNKMAYNII